MDNKKMNYINKYIVRIPINHSYGDKYLQLQRTYTKLISQKHFINFYNSLPIILKKVFEERDIFETSGTADHLRKISEYNVIEGKKLRGTLALHTYHTLQKPENVTEESLYQAHVLAWAVEMVHSCFVISDDITGDLKLRRGKSCWHLLPDVGPRAVNDMMLLKCFIYEMLKVTFEKHPYYEYVSNLFDKAFLYTTIGQHLDYMTSKMPDRKYSDFTMEKYRKIISYKTSYYSFQLPVLLGLVLVHQTDTESQHFVENICNDISCLFQMQDDYLDCFGEWDVMGKMGTDIQEGKCSWLAVAALQRCTQPQRVVFRACYGSKEPAHIERIKRLYEQLQIPKVYQEEETLLYRNIKQKIEHSLLPTKLFLDFLNILYDRKR